MNSNPAVFSLRSHAHTKTHKNTQQQQHTMTTTTTISSTTTTTITTHNTPHTTDINQQATNNKQQTTNTHKTTNNQQPTTDNNNNVTQNGEVCSADASAFSPGRDVRTWKSGNYFFEFHVADRFDDGGSVRRQWPM